MAQIDTRPAKLDIIAAAGDDLSVTLTTTTTTWLDGETLSAPITTFAGASTGVSFTTSWSAGTLQLSLTDTQTGTTLGEGRYKWALTGTEAGVTTTHLAGVLQLTAQSSGSGSTSVSGTVTVTAQSVALTVNSSALGSIEAHIADTVDAHDASAISFVPTGSIAATDVQAAVAEVASEAAAALTAATPAASTTVSGLVELATNAEALAATDAVRAVTPANLAQFTTLARYNGQRVPPSGAISQSIPRWSINVQTFGFLLSGQQTFVLVWLPLGTVNTITFMSGTTAAVTPTNQWFSIYAATTLTKLAVTADDTTTAWGASAAKTLTIPGGYSVTTEGLYYVGCMVAAATTPTLVGANVTATNTLFLTPKVMGRDATNTGLTTPATAPATAASLTVSSGVPWCYVS